jgi:L-lactate utilization protein LutB
MSALNFYGQQFMDEVRRTNTKPMAERKEAAREHLDEQVDAWLNDVIIMVERDEAGILLEMDRKDAVEFIGKVWRKNYEKQ